MNNIINIEEYRKNKNDKMFSQYAFLRPFDLDNLKYNNKVKKNGITFIISVYLSPYDGRNLLFDVYNKNNELIKIALITEEENYFIPNLDYHIWNKIDGDTSNNPISEDILKKDIDERDLLPPWDKKNQGRFVVVEREDYEDFMETFNNIIDTVNGNLKEAYDKTMKKS